MRASLSVDALARFAAHLGSCVHLSSHRFRMVFVSVRLLTAKTATEWEAAPGEGSTTIPALNQRRQTWRR